MVNLLSNIADKMCGPLHYTKHGTRRAGEPVFVFLHGNSHSSAVFEDFVAQPFFKDKLSYCFDLPGHGGSMPLPADSPYTFETIADRLIKAFNALDFRNVVLVGWSLGGHVALEMLERSDRIDSAVIMSVPPMRPGALATFWAYHFSLDMLLASKKQFTATDAARFERLTIGASADGRYINDLQSVDPAMRPSVARGVLHGSNHDQYQQVLTTQKPLLIIQGDSDPLIRSSYLNNLAKTDGFSARYELLVDAGHAPFIDKPQEVQSLIADFFATQSAQRPMVEEKRRSAA